MKKLTQVILTILLGLATLAPITAWAQFDPFNEVCNGASSSTVCTEAQQTQTPQSNSIYGRDGLLTKAANIVSIVVGIASVIMIVVGGFKYVSSGGDSGQISNARRTVIYALVGMLIVLFAQAIILFVFNRL